MRFSGHPDKGHRIKDQHFCCSPKKERGKGITKIHRVYLVLANHSWAWGLSFSVVDIPSDTLVKETDFLSDLGGAGGGERI